MEYGQEIIWTDFLGSKTKYKVSGCNTPEEATKKVLRWAIKKGWTNPKWWELWRWADSRMDIKSLKDKGRG